MAKSSCAPCLPAWEHGFGPYSATRLVVANPDMVSIGTLRHPFKVVCLMTRVKPGCVQDLCASAPKGVLGTMLPELLAGLEKSHIRDVLVPLLNDERLTKTLAALLSVLGSGIMITVLRNSTEEKLKIVLRAPAAKLCTCIKGIHIDCVSTVLLPILREPASVLQNTLVPLLKHMEKPERLSKILNEVEPDVLLWMLREGDPKKLAAVADALEPEDLEPNGKAILLLKELTDFRGLVRTKVLPCVSKTKPDDLAYLVHGIRAGQLLEVLRRVEVQDMVLLLESTNRELVVRVFNGPLEDSVAMMAGGMAKPLGAVLKHKMVATGVKQATDNAAKFANEVETNVQRAKTMHEKNVQQAKQLRDVNIQKAQDFTESNVQKAKQLHESNVRKAKQLHESNVDRAKQSVDQMKGTVGDLVRQGKQARGATEDSGNAFGNATGIGLDLLRSALRFSNKDEEPPPVSPRSSEYAASPASRGSRDRMKNKSGSDVDAATSVGQKAQALFDSVQCNPSRPRRVDSNEFVEDHREPHHGGLVRHAGTADAVPGRKSRPYSPNPFDDDFNDTSEQIRHIIRPSGIAGRIPAAMSVRLPADGMPGRFTTQ